MGQELHTVKKIGTKILKIIRNIVFIILSLILIFLLVRSIGKAVNNRTPKGGINESMYVEINGTQQWISIYGCHMGPEKLWKEL